MKQKLKTISKLLFLFLLLAFSSCQDDFDDEYQNSQYQKVSFKSYSLKEANKIPKFKNVNGKVVRELSKARRKNNASARESLSEIIIDSSTVKEISFDNFTSYTMLIEKDDPTQNYFENLVIHMQNDTLADVFTIKYTPTGPAVYNEITKLYDFVGEFEPTRGVTTFHGSSGEEGEASGGEWGGGLTGGGGGSSVTSCGWFMMCDRNINGGLGVEHFAGANCTNQYLKQICSSISTTGYTGFYGGSGAHVPGGGGGTPTTTTTPVTTPVRPKTPEEIKADIFKIEFYDPLVQSKKDYLTANNIIYKEVRAYVMSKIVLTRDGDWIDQEVEDFAKEAISALMNGGQVDFRKQIILAASFVNTKTDCIHKKLLTNLGNLTTPNSFYSQMTSNFSSNTSKNLTFEIGNTSNGDWGITKGNSNLSNNYTIIISQNIENGSNLMKIVTLGHELIHAYMYSVLETNSQLTFDINGDPVLNVTCNNGVNYNNVNLNGLSINDRFDILICAMNQNNTLSSQWTHDLFNTTVFDVNTYRQKLETLIFNEYDWNSENASFKNEAINLFGNNWEQEIAKAVSWIGLENTAEYNTYYNTYYANPQKQLYITLIRTKITNANNNCQ